MIGSSSAHGGLISGEKSVIVDWNASGGRRSRVERANENGPAPPSRDTGPL